MRIGLLSLLPLVAACKDPGIRGQQAPVKAWLVVHIDPLAREAGGDCEDPRLFECGTPVAASWEQRSTNLGWLLDTWTRNQRTVDLQVGPEMATAWAEEAGIVEALVADFQVQGDVGGTVLAEAEARARAAEVAEGAREAIGRAMDEGTAALGVHVHTVLPDPSGAWATAPKRAEGPEACAAWEAEPLGEAEASVVEEVVSYGVASAGLLADQLEVPLTSFTGHLPRTLAGKAQVLEDPDGLDPEVSRAFSAAFAPTTLGSAYSECLIQSVDHPPFEAWWSGPERALGQGEGPLVIPGERVVGSMDEHLGAIADGATGAATRRILQLMLTWRAAGLQGEGDRAWTYTFHTHLFHLNPGTVGLSDLDGRTARTRSGVPLRKDADGVAAFLDRFADQGAWQGVEAEGGGVVQWSLPGDVEEGSDFDYVVADEAPPEGFEEEAYPYLPLVAERLANTHLTCVGELGRTELYGLMRCEAGWAWGEGSIDGYRCQDGASPQPVYVLVPDGEDCVRAPGAEVSVGAIDDLAMGSAEGCTGGLRVPDLGLIVDAPEGAPRWDKRCEALLVP